MTARPTAAEVVYYGLSRRLNQLPCPWHVTWHALERFIERFAEDLSYEDAMDLLAEECSRASYTGLRTKTTQSEIWLGDRACFIVSENSETVRSGKLALITVHEKPEAGYKSRKKRKRPRFRNLGDKREKRVARAELEALELEEVMELLESMKER